MLPILVCSILALAIILERSWALRQGQVMPDGLLAQARGQGVQQIRVATLGERLP